ncbi:MAG: 2-C-methyl-D-erythritol 4-phosphate cytidylyltransferase [Actinomycetota bacterium]|nr:2-C-methyl-D-erythritol 4-phosphate cytidylyltransferase [Actinomycetota bacterium]
MSEQVWTVVVAGGAGTRFGSHKQFEALGGRSLVAWALSAARSVSDGVVLVVPAGVLEAGTGMLDAGTDVPDAGTDGPDGHRAGVDGGADVVVCGGATRAESVRAGLAAVPASAGVVVVHDAARPLATPALFRAVVEAVRRPGGPAGAVPGVPVHDTVKRVAGGLVAATVDRQDLVAVQTPQAFRADVLRRAHAGGGDATDDAGLVEALGLDVAIVPGDPRNRKVTTPEDLVVAGALLARRDDDAVPGAGPGPGGGAGLGVVADGADPEIVAGRAGLGVVADGADPEIVAGPAGASAGSECRR